MCAASLARPAYLLLAIWPSVPLPNLLRHALIVISHANPPTRLRLSPIQGRLVRHFAADSAVAKVVSNHKGWVQRREITDDNRVMVEPGLGFHDERNGLQSLHIPDLALRRRGKQVTNIRNRFSFSVGLPERYQSSQKDAFDVVLRSSHSWGVGGEKREMNDGVSVKLTASSSE